MHQPAQAMVYLRKVFITPHIAIQDANTITYILITESLKSSQWLKSNGNQIISMLEILAAILENGDQIKFRRICKSKRFFHDDNNK